MLAHSRVEAAVKSLPCLPREHEQDQGKECPQVWMAFLPSCSVQACSWLTCWCFHPQIGAVSRIPGITPAAVVNLLRFVKTHHQKTEKAKASRQAGKDLPGKMFLEQASFPRADVSRVS